MIPDSHVGLLKPDDARPVLRNRFQTAHGDKCDDERTEESKRHKIIDKLPNSSSDLIGMQSNRKEDLQEEVQEEGALHC